VDIAISSNASTVFTSNRDSGTVSVIDLQSRNVVDELPLGGQPCGLAMPTDECLLVLDSAQHQLVRLQLIESKWMVAQRIEVAEYPVSIVLDAMRNRCYVASLWSRSVTSFSISPETGELRLLDTISLPFAPRQMSWLHSGDQLLVAGAFSARLAVINTTDGLALYSMKSLAGHNVRGLAKAAHNTVLLTRQVLNPLAHTTRDDIHWGNTISNQLVSISVSSLLDNADDLESRCTVTLLGEPGNAAGDPGSITVLGDGTIAVMLSGTNEIAFGASSKATKFTRKAVGVRPAASVVRGRLLWVANTYSDSVSVVELDGPQVAEITLGKSREWNNTEHGEMLFHDSRLGLDGWMSCSSCHTDGHTNEQLNDNFSDGSFGSPKRVLSLLAVAETGPWAWNGSVKSLREQVDNSVRMTMHGKPISTQQADAIVEYMRTLKLPKLSSSRSIDSAAHLEQIEKGKQVFESSKCASCHEPPLLTTSKSYTLDDSNQPLNPPSLRAVKHASRFFHDSRAGSLEEVFSRFGHQLNSETSEDEIESLIAYLRSL
jgi:YVTN family beta-propeller protein